MTSFGTRDDELKRTKDQPFIHNVAADQVLV